MTWSEKKRELKIVNYIEYMIFYAGGDIQSYFQKIINDLIWEIHSQNDTYILNVGFEEYSAHLLQKYTIDIPEFHFDKVSVSTSEKNISGSEFPSGFFILDKNNIFRKQIFTYHIPYTGNISLLEFKPNPRVMRHFEAEVDRKENCLLIEIINFYNDDTDKIKQSYNESLSNLSGNYNYIKNNCDEFNKALETFIVSSLDARKKQVLQKNNLLASLGVPIRSNTNTPETFSIPSPKLKEKIIVKPIVHESGFKPEPALNNETYQKILKFINDIGKNFERMPSTYKWKSEEDIRDHILLILDPNFELGSASGETFNKSWKTDILLRYDSSVVFVGECKYWKWEKVFLGTIDQLLGYLTWRNSKVSIINFVQNSEFSEVLEKIKISIKKHPNFLKELEANDETWFNYKFHLNGDKNREIDLAVISFHLPK